MEVASGPKPPQTAPRLFRGSSEVGAFEGRGAEAWRGRHKGSSRNCSGEPPTARLGCRMYSSGDTSVILFWDQDLAVCYKLPLICALFFLPHVGHASIWLYFQQIFVWP